MSANPTLEQIYTNLKQKTRILENILSTTNEMTRILLDDDESFSILLGSRSNLMKSIDNIDENNKKLISTLCSDLKSKVDSCLSPSGTDKDLDGDSTLTGLYNTSRQNRKLVKRLIDENEKLNKFINKKSDKK